MCEKCVNKCCGRARCGPLSRMVFRSCPVAGFPLKKIPSEEKQQQWWIKMSSGREKKPNILAGVRYVKLYSAGRIVNLQWRFRIVFVVIAFVRKKRQTSKNIIFFSSSFRPFFIVLKQWSTNGPNVFRGLLFQSQMD